MPSGVDLKSPDQVGEVQRGGVVARWRRYLLTPVNGASLALFRMCFGAIMVWEVWRYFSEGWIQRYYIEPTFFFSYPGFSFVQPWSGTGMYWHFLFLGQMALFIACGLYYRLATVLFFLAFSYVFLLDKTQYLNHFYLICLISLLLALVPAHRVWSLDHLRTPARQENTVPRWCLLILRAQIVLVYFFGGVAKLNSDWLRGEPLRAWLAERTDLPLLGSYLTLTWVVLLFAYGALIIDLSIGFLLCWRRTFWLGAALALVFNLLNAQLFPVGIFPYFMIATLVLFPKPDWPRRLLRRRFSDFGSSIAKSAIRHPASETALLVLLHVYMLVQIALPLRHWLYPGNVNWTEEGHRFSWHMMLRDKHVELVVFATDPYTGTRRVIDGKEWLTKRQLRKMAWRPDMILQFAHFVADQEQAKHGARPIITARARGSLNSRPKQDLIDPHVDLAAQPVNLWPARWIVPLHE